MANARVHRDVVKGTAGALRRDWCWMYWMYWAYWMLVAKSLRPHIAGPRTTGASQDQASRVIQVPCDSAQGNSVCGGGGWGKLGWGTGPKVLFPAACFQLPCFHANALFTTALGDWPSGLQGRESCSGARGGTTAGRISTAGGVGGREPLRLA